MNLFLEKGLIAMHYIEGLLPVFFVLQKQYANISEVAIEPVIHRQYTSSINTSIQMFFSDISILEHLMFTVNRLNRSQSWFSGFPSTFYDSEGESMAWNNDIGSL